MRIPFHAAALVDRALIRYTSPTQMTGEDSRPQGRMRHGLPAFRGCSRRVLYDQRQTVYAVLLVTGNKVWTIGRIRLSS